MKERVKEGGRKNKVMSHRNLLTSPQNIAGQSKNLHSWVKAW